MSRISFTHQTKNYIFCLLSNSNSTQQIYSLALHIAVLTFHKVALK